MVLQIGDVWRLYNRTVIGAKKGTTQGLIIRKKGVHRTSKYVMAINDKFKEVAETCKTQVANLPKRKKLIKYQECVAKALEGIKAEDLLKEKEKKMGG